MLCLSKKMLMFVALALTAALALVLAPAPSLNAADHGDAPLSASDQGADLNDIYAFLDPNDNSRVVLILTAHGFIVPNEMVNFGIFDENVRFRLELEFTGDARPDRFLDVRFSPKNQSATQPQTATISLPNGVTITAPSTVPNLSPNSPAPVITEDSATGVRFFAGVTDDPFFFDITGFSRYAAPPRNGTGPPDRAALQRGRDSFAGYNTLAFAISIPITLLRQAGANNEIGVNSVGQRRSSATINRAGNVVGFGRWVPVDRAANPAVSIAFVRWSRKNEFNASTPLEDQAGKFLNDILPALRAFGTNDTFIGILANVAVARGDFLRLSLTQPNSGPGGGNNSQAAFPNGRRLQDDVIDTELTLINNGVALSDNANANDATFRDAFPFLAPSIQPFAPGTGDDRTRN